MSTGSKGHRNGDRPYGGQMPPRQASEVRPLPHKGPGSLAHRAQCQDALTFLQLEWGGGLGGWV